MADNSSISTAVQDLKAQSAAGGGGLVTADGPPRDTPAGAKAPMMSQALDFINRGIHEKDVMSRAAELNIPYVDVSTMPINPDLLKLITKEVAVASKLMPFILFGKKLHVAVVDPEFAPTKEKIEAWKVEGYEVVLHLCSQESLTQVVLVFDAQQSMQKQEIVTNVEEARVGAFEKEITLLSDLKDKIQKVTSEEALNLIEVGAMKTGSSDMHFEPEEKSARVRFRIDGELHKVFDLDLKTYLNVVNQLKYKCRMKMNITTVPQDGRYGFTLNERKIDVRVSCIPTQYGESFVCRLLDSGRSLLEFKDMGFQGAYLEKMEKLSTLSHGMILVTGPTGSGKTTTLYSLLGKFNQPDAKVITLEDPIEYHLTGISQSQIDVTHGYDFAGGLRTILRQDPDVVMVGEIRDLETATVAAQAALTGHVMLSTIHTNSAVESIPRIVNMGLPEFIIAPALHTIIAQRLVRKLCACAEKRPMTEDEKAKFAKDVETIRGVVPDITVKIPALATMPTDILIGKGCEKCSNTGFKGRVVIVEIITIDSEMQELILAKTSAPKLFEAARKKGMITMQEDGILKVLQGLTTMEEVFEATNVAA